MHVDAKILRALADCDGRAGAPLGKAMLEAADTIEAQAALIAEAREAVKSFREPAVFSESADDNDVFVISVGTFRRLRALSDKLDRVSPDPVPHDRRIKHERG